MAVTQKTYSQLIQDKNNIRSTERRRGRVERGPAEANANKWVNRSPEYTGVLCTFFCIHCVSSKFFPNKRWIKACLSLANKSLHGTFYPPGPGDTSVTKGWSLRQVQRVQQPLSQKGWSQLTLHSFRTEISP